MIENKPGTMYRRSKALPDVAALRRRQVGSKAPLLQQEYLQHKHSVERPSACLLDASGNIRHDSAPVV